MSATVKPISDISCITNVSLTQRVALNWPGIKLSTSNASHLTSTSQPVLGAVSKVSLIPLGSAQAGSVSAQRCSLALKWGNPSKCFFMNGFYWNQESLIVELTSLLCPHSPEVWTVAGTEEMSCSGFAQMKFEKFARYMWSPLFISKLISRFPPESTEVLLRVKKKSHQMKGNLRGLPEDPSLQASFHSKWLQLRPTERRSQAFTFLPHLFQSVLWRRGENANALLILEPSTHSFWRFFYAKVDF